MSSASQYTRTNAIPNQPICLRSVFSKFGLPFDPFAVTQVQITKKDPRAVDYDEGTDLLETIPGTAISKIGSGTYQYVTANTSITEIGTFYDVVSFQFESGGTTFILVNNFVVTTSGLPKVGYVTIDELRAEGLDETKYPDTLVQSRIAFNSTMIDRFCGQFFEARKLILDLNGPGAWEQSINIPIVNVEEVVLLDREFPVTKVFTFDLDDLVIYNRHITQGLTYPDDREDPRIGNVYFPMGRQNVRVTGTFGYTDLQGNTPTEIKRALMLMILRDKEPLFSPKRSSSLASSLAGPILEEKTDDHSYKVGAATRSQSTSGYFTGDPEIDMILWDFRRPAHMGVALGANVTTGIDGGTEFDRFRAGFDFFFGRSV